MEQVTIAGRAPTLVFLHDGLGCVSTWRDFPARVAAATGCAAFVYSRAGYGGSEPITLPRPVTYMHDEARRLPEILRRFSIDDFILVGHSDGASISILFADAPGLRGMILEAPHVFCEEVCVRRIAADREAYLHGELRQRLLRHHGANTDCAFWGWNGAWLDPDFRRWDITPSLARVRVPLLVIQGADDEYGTLAQLQTIERLAHGPVERLVLDACGHSPHRDQPERTLAAMTAFIRARASGDPSGT